SKKGIRGPSFLSSLSIRSNRALEYAKHGQLVWRGGVQASGSPRKGREHVFDPLAFSTKVAEGRVSTHGQGSCFRTLCCAGGLSRGRQVAAAAYSLIAFSGSVAGL